MEKPYPLMKVPSLDVIHGWRSVIRGCHPWMEKYHPWMEKCHKTTDDGHGRSKNFVTLSGAEDDSTVVTSLEFMYSIVFSVRNIIPTPVNVKIITIQMIFDIIELPMRNISKYLNDL